jgi:hypothetical protein
MQQERVFPVNMFLEPLTRIVPVLHVLFSIRLVKTSRPFSILTQKFEFANVLFYLKSHLHLQYYCIKIFLFQIIYLKG